MHVSTVLSLGALLIASVVSGCTSFHAERVGYQRYAPTDPQQISIWSSDELWERKATLWGGSEPSEPYSVIGTLNAAYCPNAETIVREFQTMASQLGADAVIIRDNGVFTLTFGDAIKYRDPTRQLAPKRRK